MEEKNIGQFIAELRKDKKMTQKELAAQLHITDKAVSKWERGLSCPDITLLTAVADILGVTTSELLNGKKSDTISKDTEETVDCALVYAEKSVKRKIMSLQNILALSFSVLLLLGIIVCVLCDVAIKGKLTWSLYPLSSIVFTWLVFIPLLKCGKNGILYAILSFSILIIPFLYVLSEIVGVSDLMLPIGIKAAVVSIAYLWCGYLIFNRLKARKILATAFSLLLLIPLCLVINFTVSKYISTPALDIWDIISFSIFIVIAVALFIIDHAQNGKNTKN